MSVISFDFKPSRTMLRQFGAIGAVVFALLGAKLFYSHTIFLILLSPVTSHTVGGALFVVAVFCAIAATVAPSMLRPLYVGLMIVGYPIGWVVSHVILAIVFYG